MAGLPDLRLKSDRFLGLAGERAKARRLARIEAATDAMGLVAAYYAITEDVDRLRREMYLSHLARAELRGACLAERVPATGPVLEVGCGSGGLLTALAPRRQPMVGIDIALRWLIIARRRLLDRGFRYPLLAANGEWLPFDDESFSTLVADSVLEHLDDPRAALREWARVVRPGGRLVLWSPNRCFPGIDPHVGLFGLGLLPRKWVPGYVRFRRNESWNLNVMTATEAATLARRAGWTDVTISVPRVSADLLRGTSFARLFRLYEYCGRSRWITAVLRTLGPVWQLEAIRKAP